jgi:hypothetical protein
MFEVEYANTGWINVPASAHDDSTIYEYTAPDGYQILSWGYYSGDSVHLSISAAMINVTDGVANSFVGNVANSDSADHSYRWTFLLLKM